MKFEVGELKAQGICCRRWAELQRSQYYIVILCIRMSLMSMAFKHVHIGSIYDVVYVVSHEMHGVNAYL